MIFAVTYKGYIKGIFFEIWNATDYAYTFNEEAQPFVEIKKISDLTIPNLRKKIEECTPINTNQHNCNNCARSLYDNYVLICDFSHQTTNPTDYCSHYL